MSKVKNDLSKNYQKKSQYEHIVDLPDSYIGSIEKIKKELYIFNDDTNKIEKREIDFIPGLERIFEEILLNAFDQQTRKNTKCNQIKVEINKEEGWISVWNNGKGIPIQVHSEYNIWIPELIFANLLTSSNYKKGEKRITGGKNGYGAKLTNIFSTKFVIETVDEHNKYVQVCTDNMKKIEKPQITPVNNKPTYTKITFYPDFTKFNIEDPITEFSDEMIGYMKKRVYDIASCSKKETTIYFNKVKIKVKNIQDYMALYFDDKRKIVYEQVNDRWSIGMCLAEDGFEQVTFVNGIHTNDGGTHVNYIVNKIVKEIKDVVSKKSKTVKSAYIKDKIFIFINSFIENPTFNSQSKEKLESKPIKYGSTCDLSQKFIKDVLKTGIKEEVLAFTEFKDNKNLNKNDGKKVKNLYGIENYEKANWAGTKNSDKCMLILTEGLSAKGFAVNGLSKIGRDRYGIFPLRGKLINVRNQSSTKITDNKEITHLKQILGLRQGMVFNKKEDFKDLRYGGILILTDQDKDGSHIKGLVMNFIHNYWPSLINVGFIKSLATPIIKAFKGKRVKKFYTETDYKKWKKTDLQGWRIKYYKGLGTHDDEEAAECFEDFENNIIHYQGCEETDYCMNLVFNNGDFDKPKKVKWSDKRKDWLMVFDPNDIIEQDQKRVTIDDFVNKDIIHFSNDDTKRSVPSVMDGLKPSQRKILYAGIKRYKRDKKELRVAEFAGYVTFESHYHHGEKSIIEATVKMAQTFVGANNVNYFMPNGDFGSRMQGTSKHASERYIHTVLNPIVNNIFNPDDELVLNLIEDDGVKVEPIHYMPVIPMILVNGADGIGTGFSTKVCSHRLQDVCNAMIDRMNGKQFPKLQPYFRGFQGRIIDLGNGSYETLGLYKIVPETNTIHILELPIGVWTDKYTKFLEDKISNQKKKKYITSYENYCTKNTVHYILKLSSDGVRKYSKREYGFIVKDFKLRNTFSTNNMHLFDANGVIKKYENTNEIFEYFYNHRKTYYVKRKKALLERMKKIVEKLKAQVMFIRYYNNKKIILRKKSKAELEAQLVQYKFPKFTLDENSKEPSYDYLTDMKIITLTNERAEQLENKYKEMENEYKKLENTTIETMWSNDIEKLREVNKKYNKKLNEKIEKEREDIGKTRSKKSKKKTTKKKKTKITLDLNNI
jgi:DNA topoisomerase-2